MDNYYSRLYDEQVLTNEYLETINSNIETIMNNDILYHNQVINNLGFIASILMIFIVGYCLLSLVLK